MHLGGRKDKDDVLRRLLERFEKRVERLGGEHMHLVHNVDAEPRTVGLELHLVDNIADVLDFAVGRGVHLDDIEHTAVLDALADSHTPHGSPFWGSRQFAAFARILAQVVLPVPREPVNR